MSDNTTQLVTPPHNTTPHQTAPRTHNTTRHNSSVAILAQANHSQAMNCAIWFWLFVFMLLSEGIRKEYKAPLISKQYRPNRPARQIALSKPILDLSVEEERWVFQWQSQVGLEDLCFSMAISSWPGRCLCETQCANC